MTITDAPTSAITTEDILVKVREILPTLQANVTAGETERRLPPSSGQAMLDAGLARILLPRRYGGYELGLDAWFQVTQAIAAVDASHGWCASLIIHHPHYLAQFPQAAQDHVWADGPDVAITAAIAPVQKITAVDGGYRISGRSAWASGVNHSTWAMVGGMLPDTRPPEHTFFLVPATDYRIEHTWDTVGMRGTGSDTIVTEDVFVPEEHTLRLSDMREGAAPGGVLHEAPYYRTPWVTYAPATFVIPMLGAAQGALESFRSALAERATNQGARVASFTSVQHRLARAGADLDAAELLVRRALHTSEDDQRPDLDLRARCMRDYGRASELVVGAVDTLLAMSGSNGFNEGQDLQRVWRDLHLASSHVSLNTEVSFPHWGRTQLGIDREPTQGMF